LKEYEKGDKLETIDRIVLAGSPVMGTLNFYPITEGGFVLDSDKLTDQFNPVSIGKHLFNTRTINDLYLKDKGNNIYDCIEVCTHGVCKCLSPYYLKEPETIKKWLEDNTTIHVIGTPTFDDSIVNDAGETKTLENKYLSDLHDNENLESLLSKDNFRTFYIENNEKKCTISALNIEKLSYIKEKNYNNFLYSVDKIVEKTDEEDKEGDGLTLAESAKFLGDEETEFTNDDNGESIDGKVHSKVIKVFKDDIVDFLNKNRGLIQKSIPESKIQE
jgi:hypothetical protein